MISEYEKNLIFYAQKYIIYQLKKKGPKKMAGLLWSSKSVNLGPDEYGLTIQKGKKKNLFSFTKDELIEEYGSREWKDRLLARITEILRRIER